MATIKSDIVENAEANSPLNGFSSHNVHANDESPDDDVKLSLNKNMDLFEEVKDKSLGNFLSQIINFHSIMPTSDEIKKKKDKADDGKPSAKLGTLLGVFLPCVQNIFGVILFIRKSWIVGTAGLFGAFAIVFLCCCCTMLTAISMSAIATNGVVPAGGSYFMISRSLGPECGGAVGILFYLANTVAASMYIVGAVEIFLKYMCPQCTIIGDIENLSDAFQNFRIYGTLLLILIGLCVFIGIKFVSKIAPISLVCVILSIICIYAGVIKSAFDPPDLKICVFNKTRLIRYEAYASANQIDKYCTNQEYCMDSRTNQTIQCPLWTIYCGPLQADRKDKNNDTSSSLDFLTNQNLNESIVLEIDTSVAHRQKYVHLCSYFKMNDSVLLRPGIPGIGNTRISETYGSKYFAEGEVAMGEEGVKESEVVGKGFTSLLILIGIYFPSVTGIMAGSNRSGDLKDPSRSIPRGTITAIVTTSTVYLTNVIVFAACIDGLLLRDKFGDSIDKQLVISLLAWPNKWVILVGAFASTVGAALQSLTGAPRLLQAVAKDEIIPFLKPFSTSLRGEPFRALLLTLAICECGILIGNLDNLTPLLAMFFLLCYGFVNMACGLQTILKAPSWRPRFKYYHWSLSLLGLLLCITIMFIIKWYYAIVSILLALCIYKYIEYKGAEKEWGDGMRGLSMSAARYALLNLEEAQPHVKNWRPQILILVKSECNETVDDKCLTADDINLKHLNLIALAAQLKASRGLTVSASVIPGNFIDKVNQAKTTKQLIKSKMNEYKIRGFCDTLVAENIEQGISHLIQTEGLGGLRHNTIIMNWPNEFKTSNENPDSLTHTAFVNILRFAECNESSVILTKGIDTWPTDKKLSVQNETIDIWWIIHDGGLLLLLVFLLQRHKIWQKCKLRIYAVAQMDENSVQIKIDLIQYIYYLRIDAEVDVVEMSDSEISAYTYEKTLKLEERERILKEMKLKDSVVENEQHNVIERVRRLSIPKHSITTTNASNVTNGNKRNLPANKVRKMHTAIEMNGKILDKSRSASLVVLNLPSPPKQDIEKNEDYNYVEYINTLTENLNRALLVRGTGREVITIFS